MSSFEQSRTKETTEPTAALKRRRPVSVLFTPIYHPDDQRQRQLVRPGDINVPEFGWNTDQAVSSEYLQQIAEILESVPKKREDLTPKEAEGVSSIADRGKLEEEQSLDKRVDDYVNPYQKPKDSDIPSFNPFGLFLPSDLENIYSWLRVQGKQYQYQPAPRRQDWEVAYKMETVQHQKNFIKVIRAWNEYYVSFLRILNIVDAQERKRQPVCFRKYPTLTSLKRWFHTKTDMRSVVMISF